MADIRLEQAGYVKFALKSEINKRLFLDYDPVGWEDDGFEFVRHKDYHGIMIQFTNDLGFYKEARDYIKNDFNILGINSKLRLEKYELTRVGNNIRYNKIYSGIVDYSTYSESDLQVKVKFNSNELEDLIKTREDDEFPLDRTTSIDEKPIPSLATEVIDLKGTGINEVTTLELITDKSFVVGNITAEERSSDYARGMGTYQKIIFRGNSITPPIMNLSRDGNNRISSPDSMMHDVDVASKMFFVDTTEINTEDDLVSSIKISYSFDGEVKTVDHRGSYNRHKRNVRYVLIRYRRNEVNLNYDIVEKKILASVISNRDNFTKISASGEIFYNSIAPNEGLAIGLESDYREYYLSSTPIKVEARVYTSNLGLNLITKKPKTTNHNFLFVDSCFKRLMEIITGDNNRFASRCFGRQADGYFTDGIYSDIALIHGFWIRNFNNEHELYKSMTISLKDLFESLKAVFNIGLGIETINGKQKLIAEDLKYFYQNKVVITLDQQISNVKRKIKKDEYYSSIEIGYSKGGEYTDTVGLDEPNTLINRITPIFRSKKKYKAVSGIRADDVGMELMRRLPASLYSDQDDSKDDNIWLLDVKKSSNGKWAQKEWPDRLRYMPELLSYANDFKSFFFTPLTMLFRHGYVIRAGLNQLVNLNKSITYINSKSKPNLKMWFKGSKNPSSESDPVLVKDLDRPIIEPELIEFNYPFSNELINEFLDKTVINYNGEKISLPNYYFKVNFVNENGQKENGFIKSFNPKDNKIELIKANDKIL